jgi:hypothetical protein
VTLFFAFVLLALAGAVVVLFAMMGELTARLPRLHVGYRDPFLRPLEEAQVGARPNAWPPPLAPIAETEGPAFIMVLSTACATCEDVATQLSEGFGNGDVPDPALVISSGSRRTGEDFVKRHGLDRMPCYVDEEGEWLIRSFGVKTSPTALVLRNGALSSAFVFGDVATLNREVLEKQLEVEAP